MVGGMLTFSHSCFPGYLVLYGLKTKEWSRRFYVGMVGWPRGQFENPDPHNGLRCFPREFLFLTFPCSRDPSRTCGTWSSTTGYTFMELWWPTGWGGLRSRWMFISIGIWRNISRATFATLTSSRLLGPQDT